MKNLISMIRLTLLLAILLCVAYPALVYGLAQFAPNHGNGETVIYNGKTVGYKLIGQQFDKDGYFWGRPSAVDYNAAGSAGSNKGPSNPDYLKQVAHRIDTFLIVHPYLKRSDIPADIVTASGSGLDPDISPDAAFVQVKRVAKQRGLNESDVKNLVKKHIEKPQTVGVSHVNVLELNLAVAKLKP